METPVKEMSNHLREINGEGVNSASKLPRAAYSKSVPRKRLGNIELNEVKRAKLDLSVECGKNAKPLPIRRPLQGKLRRSMSLSELPTENKMTARKKPIAVATKVAIENVKPLQRSVNENRAPVNRQASGVSTGTTRRRPAWDIKGRLEDLEKKHKVTVAAKLNLEEMLSQQIARSGELDTTRQQLNEIQCQHSVLQLQHSSLKLEVVDVKKENKQFKEENASLKVKTNYLEAENLKLKTRLEIDSEKLAEISEEFHFLKREKESLIETVKELRHTITDLNEKRSKEEIIRRNLHNTIMELKGNIRVFCRVRPPLDSEESKNILTMEFSHPEQNKIGLVRSSKDSNINENSCGRNRSSTIEFSFDKVFEPNATQEEVFEEISQLIQSSLDGYHVCIFAYGQTGSGKTYTMEGPKDSNGTNVGMIRRAVDQVFESIYDLTEKGWKYNIEVSMVEIYNETVRDLLTKGSSRRDLKTKDNEVVVNDTTVIVINTSEEVHKLMRIAQKNRAVAATKCNDHSSRSHSVFMMKIKGENKSTGQNCCGALNLIDLAGSERLKQSESVGARLTETKHINSSLSNLGTVIMALGQKAEHIPYRNSKLTYLLKNSLGGQSKMLMFVNISPLKDHEQETINSLRFAKQVNECHIGPPQKK